MIKAFVSATSYNLSVYRQKALEICHRFGFQPIINESHNGPHEVDEAALYIGIFAYQYGIIEGGLDKSIIELEFDRAVEQNIDRLCFIVDPGYSWPPEAIDYENRTKLEAFKRRIDKY